MNNSEQWKKNSDEWVKTMEASRIKKEEYNKYRITTKNPLSYRDWLAMGEIS
jgi:hypothetical protein